MKLVFFSKSKGITAKGERRVTEGELASNDCEVKNNSEQIVQYLLISTIFFNGIYFPLLHVKIHS